MSMAGDYRPSAAGLLGKSSSLTRYNIADLRSRLPATPLWLAGLYSPYMAAVGAYVPPPIWFGIFIFLMEIITLGFPIVGVFKAQSLRRETLEAIAEWEKRQALNNLDDKLAPQESTKDGSVY